MLSFWDDHEFSNDSYKDGAENHGGDDDDFAREGTWTTRRDAATRAYHEWMPIRTNGNMDDPNDRMDIWQELQWGKLAKIVGGDTRAQARTQFPLGTLEDTVANAGNTPGAMARRMSTPFAWDQVRNKGQRYYLLENATRDWNEIRSNASLAMLGPAQMARLETSMYVPAPRALPRGRSLPGGRPVLALHV